MELKIRFNKIYILCPANCVTGGPDALHQIAFYLNILGINSTIAYVSNINSEIKIPDPYKIYIDSFTTKEEIIDNEENAIILPETYAYLAKEYKKAKVFIWWLSVDNNLKNTSLLSKLFYCLTFPIRYVLRNKIYRGNAKKIFLARIKKKKYCFSKEQENISHMCASYYALDYVGTRSQKPVYKAIEPISKKFLEQYNKHKDDLSIDNRSNIIIYNPKKSGKYIKKLKNKYSDLYFLPLTGLSQDELIAKYKTSKLFIDFGPFPGAERMPKEAVLYGCAIITGKHGASAFYGDVPINDDYKFIERHHKAVYEKIKYILDHYNEVYSDFNEYREVVLNLETGFINSLKELFFYSE
ncbi:MAG: hypothetical protein ACI4VK_05965 [Candidatus Coproplasma sp.]